ncbi:MAG: hypothetical protein J5929_01870 [Eubacterium sp.]|nr:hypothetical protein [Eubacterium sp.]
MHIPDITERFPEGFGGVDMTDRYFPLKGTSGYSDIYSEYNDLPSEYIVEGSGTETRRYSTDDWEKVKSITKEMNNPVIWKYNHDKEVYEVYHEDGQDLIRTFNEGDEYLMNDWFTGGTAIYKVKDRTDTSVIFTVYRHELDGEHECNEEYDITIDEDGNEKVILFTFHGTDCILEAEIKGEK